MSSANDDFSTTEILESPPPRRRLPRPLVLAALTAAVVTASAGVAFATTDSPSPGSPAPTVTVTATASPAPSSSPSTGEDKGSDDDWAWGHFMFGVGIHGEYVVRGEQEGQYVTVARQLGEVTAVDQDSITVKSADGYTREYVVNSETRVNDDEGISAVKVGHKVAVTATVEGGTATARAILDGDLREQRPWHHKRWRGPGGFWDHDGWWDRDRGDRDEDEDEASPTPSATVTS